MVPTALGRHGINYQRFKEKSFRNNLNEKSIVFKIIFQSMFGGVNMVPNLAGVFGTATIPHRTLR